MPEEKALISSAGKEFGKRSWISCLCLVIELAVFKGPQVAGNFAFHFSQILKQLSTQSAFSNINNFNYLLQFLQLLQNNYIYLSKN